jgi:hypothetical protein
MTEPPARSGTDAPRILLLVWALVATLVALIATALAVFFFLRPHQPGRDAGWVRWEKSAGGNGHWYKAVALTNGITWHEADLIARSHHAYLATPVTAAENQFIFSLVDAPEFFSPEHGSGPALGGVQAPRAPEPAGGWFWVSGEPWTYSNWFPGEPNNGRNGSKTEDRLHFYSGAPNSRSATWNDMIESDRGPGNPMPGYILEREE